MPDGLGDSPSVLKSPLLESPPGNWPSVESLANGWFVADSLVKCVSKRDVSQGFCDVAGVVCGCGTVHPANSACKRAIHANRFSLSISNRERGEPRRGGKTRES